MLRLRKSSHIKITFREEAIVPGEATATTALTGVQLLKSSGQAGIAGF